MCVHFRNELRTNRYHPHLFTDYDARQDPSVPRTLLTMSGEAHAKRRRIWNRGMSSDSIEDYMDSVTKRAEQLIECLGNIKGPVDLAEWISYFSSAS